MDEEPNEILYKIRFTRDKVLKAIEKSNKKAASGPDGIDNNLLYNLREVLAGPLASIFQESMDTGEYYWKWQHVIPVLKPGKNKNKAEPYRPISLTSQIPSHMPYRS